MMDREHIQKLLGGYATGTLTPEEQQALFEAALTDQELFDALAREQSLRDLLRDPAARAQLLASIDDAPLPWYRRFWRPMAIAAAAAACLIVAGIFMTQQKRQPVVSPLLVAEMKEPAAPPPVALPPTPAPVPAPAPAGDVRAKAMKRPVAAAPPVRVDEAMPAAPKPAAPLMAAPAPPPPQPATPADLKKETIEVTASAAVIDGTAATSGALQNAFLDGGSKPIPLQNARALFYAQQAPTFVQQPAQQGAQSQQSQSGALTPQQRQAVQDLTAQSRQAFGAMRAKTASPHLGVKWTILRQRGGGLFEEAEPGDLRAGDSVKLRLIPNDDGFLSVWISSSALMTATRAQRLIPIDTPVITSPVAGQKILTVQLTRSAPPQPELIHNVAEQQSATDAREHATYVLNVKDSPAAPISVRIPLTFQ
ncbi:conserved hypothetical protein [Candidatus Sulfopaludibacter sp. SbA3]|nr:conserved hypothetical protein [Candidatus Sulfopaludibacter sp. SbA3]